MSKEPIAIVGIGCRLPGGVRSAEQLHRFLLERRSAIVEVPKDRWDAEQLFHPDYTRPGRIHVKRGGFVDAVADFDPAFFGISPNEARRMDPQQRLVLETAFEALEDAGTRLEDVAGRPVAVVIGCSANDYDSVQGAVTERAAINGTTNTGLASSIVSNRVSYLFDLRGPSFTVDTACSSSLTALHHACRAIWEGAADAALAGGVNLILAPVSSIGFSKGGYLSPDGECRAFSDDANGYVRSEGAGVVFLKRLSAALADGDEIRALIRGTWLNQDGRTPGMTMPSQAAQEALLRGALRDGGVDPAQISYVEAHGTGTPAGDPIEATAIGTVVGAARPQGGICWMGSVKTNLGHLESAAGMAGLIKLALVLERRTLYPNRNFRAPNPKIPFDALKLRVPLEAQPLPKDGPLFGGVNSFGFGGANAHAVLESPPPRASAPRSKRPGPHSVFLSARSPTALRTMTAELAEQLERDKSSLPDLSAALSRRRSRFEFRLAASGKEASDVAATLRRHLDGQADALLSGRAQPGSSENVAFVFSGQGGQWWAMGRELFEHEPRFRRTVEQVDAELKRLGWLAAEKSSLIAELHKDEAQSRMGETQVAQPALFALEVGLANVLLEHGVKPKAVVGHSIGELGAAHIAGILSLEEAARIVYWRSRCQAQAEGKGAMAAIGLSEAEVSALLLPLKGAVEIAAINGPKAITVAGTTPDVEGLVRTLEAKNVFCRRLNVSVPFHCRLMDPIEQDFRRNLSKVAAREGALPFYSTVTGGLLKGTGLDLDYWYQNIRAPVRYLQAFTRLHADGFNCFVEVGPTPSLKQGSTDAAKRAVFIPTLRNKGSDRDHLQATLSALFTAGVACDAMPSSEPNRPVPLPRHPFERTRQWAESEDGAAVRLATGAPAHPHLSGLARGVKDKALFSAALTLDARAEPYLADHRVQGLLVFPGAGQLEAVQTAAQLSLPGEVFLEDVEFRVPLVLNDGEAATQFKLEVYSDEGHFQIASQRDGAWLTHSRGRIQHGADRFVPKGVDLAAVRARIAKPADVAELFSTSAQAGLELGPTFRGIQKLWTAPGEALARVELPPALTAESRWYLLHPALVDSVIQTAALGALLRAYGSGERSGLYLPQRVGRFQIHKRGYTGPLWCCARVEERVGDAIRTSVWAVDDEGQSVVSVEDLIVRQVQGSVRDTAATHPSNHYRWTWTEAPLPDAKVKRRPQGTWVVLGNDAGPAAEALSALGRVIHVSPKEHLAPLERLAPGEKIAGLVHLSLLAGADGYENAEKLGQVAATAWIAALNARGGWAAGAEVWLVTRDLFAPQPRISAAGLWGFGRVLMSEQPRLSTTLVDVSGDAGLLLAEELMHGPSDSEVCLRGSERFVHALNRERREGPPTIRVDAAREPYGAIVGTPGVLQSVRLERLAAPVVGPHDIEVAVRATGLNFRDVVGAMGLLPGEAWKNGLSAGTDLGSDCAGVVLSVGAEVKGFKKGDEIVGCAARSLGNRAVVLDALAVLKPRTLTFEQAAALPTVYTTALLGLEKLGRLQPNETVLIHSAAGGVGLAAIHVAQRIGARVIATAGSDDKRRVVEAMGVKHVFSSRSPEFREQVLGVTQGRGADVILSAMTGPLLTQSVRSLAPFGRFIEIGKADLYANRQLGLEFFAENRSYQVLDVNRWVAGRPSEIGTELKALLTRIEQGDLPPLPVTVFPVERSAEALSALSQGKHVGKIVVQVPASGSIEVHPGPRVHLDDKGAYLVTGGTQGFGLEVAGWLAARGAKRVVLASRSGADAPGAAERIAGLKAKGVDVTAARCDVSDLGQVKTLVASLPELKGVFHCAMVLDDAPIEKLDAERFARVSRPKAVGAWNLHEATLDRPLEHFVLFSSIASVLGTPGQANYAAANAYLDALAQLRHALGRPAAAINFGVLDAGVVARASQAQRQKITSQGVGMFGVDEALAAMEQVLLDGDSNRVVAAVNWNRIAGLPRADGRPLRFGGLAASKVKAADGSNLREDLLALPEGEQAAFLGGKIAAHVAALAGLSAPADLDTSLARFGLDSLMSIQLQSWVEARLQVTVPLMKILKGASIRELSTDIVALAARASRHAPHAWLKRLTTPASPKARLFCFSYMTSEGDAFASWVGALDPSIELWTVQYPDLGGEHDALLRGPPEGLLNLAATELTPLTDLPFGFYGHSMGGWVALDVARELEHLERKPRFVAVGALPTVETMRSIVPPGVKTPEEISDDHVLEVLGRMQVPAALLEAPAFRQAAIARTRRDLWLGVQGAFDRDERPVPRSPLWVFGGSDDPVLTVDKQGAQRGFDAAGVVAVPGGHLFVEEPVGRTQVTAQLSQFLLAPETQ
jgi:acyl transferase domain-containing protein/NADPH:quinone reductase-like Zn-dependent oxidoreductase/surfactin synthase thioesterase subunit/NAD(P)-dependent dehydrogenase (short-subunit alcohol dehydrogenase family)